MRRVLATTTLNVRVQAVGGFWLVALLTGVVVGTALVALAPDTGRWLPVVVLAELVVTSFYFAAVQVLRERNDGTLPARALSPLGPGEYLTALVISLTLLGLAEIGLLVLLVHGPRVHWPALAAGVALASCLYALYGVITVAGYRSMDTFLLPSGLWTLVLGVPILPFLGGPDGWWLWCHPLQGAVVLSQIAVGQRPGALAVPCLLTGLVWSALLGAWARARLHGSVVESGRAS